MRKSRTEIRSCNFLYKEIIEKHIIENVAKRKDVRKIIIIGSGISGLTAGIYGQKSGYETEIYEKNPVAGGLCASWVRDGMPIDGCIHWMTGTKKGTEIRGMWDNLHAFKDEDLIQSDNFGTVEYEGQKITFWCDLNKLRDELLAISPEDKKMIKRTIYMIYKIQNMPLPTDIPLSEMSVWRKLKFVLSVFPYLKMYALTRRNSREDFAKKFKHPAIRYAFSKIVPGDGNMYSTLYAYGTVALGNGGVLKGGSASLIKNLVDMYEDRGGIIHYNFGVQKILIENGEATGIVLKNGEVKKADYIISACDVNHTFDLLENKYHIKAFQKRFEKPEYYPTPSCVYISYKIDYETYKNLGISPIFQFNTIPFSVGKREENSISIRTYSYDENFIKDGCVLATTLIHQSNEDFIYWSEAFENRKDYTDEKNRIANEVVERIIARFPELEGKIKVIDVCTPLTYQRYTNSYCGSYMPFAYTSKGSIYYSKGKIKGVKCLMLAGQWMVLPGGIPIAMMSGKFAIQRILQENHRWYKISRPMRFKFLKKK